MAVDPSHPVRYETAAPDNVPLPPFDRTLPVAAGCWLIGLAPMAAGWWAPWIVAATAVVGLSGLAVVALPVLGTRDGIEPGRQARLREFANDETRWYLAWASFVPSLAALAVYLRRSLDGEVINLIYVTWMIGLVLVHTAAVTMASRWVDQTEKAGNERRTIIRNQEMQEFVRASAWIGKRTIGGAWLNSLTVIPAARIIRMTGLGFGYAVVSGTRVAFVRIVSWECGHYARSADGTTVLHNGQSCRSAAEAATHLLTAAVAHADLLKVPQVAELGDGVTAFLVIRGEVSIDAGVGEAPLPVLAIDEAVDAIGRHLVGEPYDVDTATVGALLRLGQHFPRA
jgi:hypothetical protein